jgi:predicted glycoside hydrolase/deacetylase ChbG (UPF0249 family)
MSKLILTADDFGACDFIDAGIYEALRSQKINTVSAFVTHIDSEQRVKELLVFREKEKEKYGMYTFNIGLHFSITSGLSLLHQPSSLTEEECSGDGNYYFREAKNYPFRKIKTTDLQDELQAQLHKLSEWLGANPIDHVSNHHGVTYVDSRLFQAYIETIASYDEARYQRNIPIRSPRSWLKSGLKVWKTDGIFVPTVRQGIELGFWKKILEVTNKKINERKARTLALAVKCPDLLADTIYGQPYTDNVRFLLEQLKGQAYSAEFMFHRGHQSQGYIDPESLTDVPHGIDHYYFVNRQKELETLLSLDTDHLIRANHLKKIVYPEL